MSDENNDKNKDFNSNLRLQVDFQQSEEALRKTRNEISGLEIQLRKYLQDYTRAKMVFEAAESKLKALKSQEFELTQNAARLKRAYISHMSKK